MSDPGDSSIDSMLSVFRDIDGLPDPPPPLPDGWVRCSERMPEAGERVQFSFRAYLGEAVAPYIAIGYRCHDEHWVWEGSGNRIAQSGVVAWRPLTVPEEVRRLT